MRQFQEKFLFRRIPWNNVFFMIDLYGWSSIGELPVISFGLKNIFKIHEMIPFYFFDLNTSFFFEKLYGRSFVD